MMRAIVRWTAIVAAGLILGGAAIYAAAWLGLDRFGWARAVVWADADVDDYRRFPARRIAAADSAYEYAKAPGYPDGLPATVAVPGGGALADFLAAHDTTAFLVIQDDRLVYEGYFNGSSHDAVQTSFSVAKSFGSAMLGAALADGSIASADAPVTDYLPDLAARDPRFADITIRHLVTMSSGLHYEEWGLPWSDDALTYYAPDLRRLALDKTHVEEEPGRRFHYNNYNPLLFGIILERATGKLVADYLSEKIWQPMGAEADATWSLDSEKNGFEKMESGINARAIDFAKLGSLYLHGGFFNGRQILPREWVEETTRGLRPTGFGTSRYGHWWWTNEDAELGPYFMARGNHGQFVFVFPRKKLVITRNGRSYGGIDWTPVMLAVAKAL